MFGTVFEQRTIEKIKENIIRRITKDLIEDTGTDLAISGVQSPTSLHAGFSLHPPRLSGAPEEYQHASQPRNECNDDEKLARPIGR